MPTGIELWLDLGDVGMLDGVEYRVLGIAARRVVPPRHDDEPERWQDYLLYNASIGFRWLSVAAGHWTYAVPVEVGPTGYEAPILGGGLDGPGLNRAGEEPPVVVELEWATGELPWCAEIGERAAISERRDLVFEHSAHDVSASRIHELTPDAVARAFHKRALPRPK
jgi:hypothetical protein